MSNNDEIETANSPDGAEPSLGATQAITIRTPASVANFGPGFETVALAVKKYLNLTVRVQAPRKQQGIQVITKGSIAAQLATDSSNLIAKVIEQVWPQDPGFLSCLSITIDTDIPIAVGLGASAAATAAGVTAAMALSGMRLEKGNIFDQVAKLEGHAESAGATVFGGFTLCAPNIVPGDMLARKLEWPEKWCLLAVIPPYKVSSKKARAALPASISHKDAVMNVQRVALLIEAVAASDDEAMRAALRDRLHEPYKNKLVAELAELKKEMQDNEVLGTILSGSGPTIVNVLDVQHKSAVLERLEKWNKSKSEPCQILELEIDDTGLSVT